mmetsp:Transcript_7263/g.6394  ORF Transcript_7263/g.6394 Transcript_7263/m.6394 type:complete len:137 (+) Transcript_7263:1008-1418(+)
MNEFGFCHGNFNLQLGDLVLKKKNLQMISYLKKEGDNVVDNDLPYSFALTPYHIIFMYPKNLTILSKITNEIVYNKNYDFILKGIQVDFLTNKALLYSTKEKILFAHLKGEDQDAWKYYLKRGLIKDALMACKTLK